MSLQPCYFNKRIFCFAQRLFSSTDPGGFPRDDRKAGEQPWTDAFHFHWGINPAMERLCDRPRQQPGLSGGKDCWRAQEHPSGGIAAAQNRGRLREKCETQKYQVRRTVRLRVNREASKKVQRSSACETRSAILLQWGFTDSNRRKRTHKRKQQPSISPLPISRVRKQSHSEKVNCAPRSKTASKAQSGRQSQDTLLSLLTKRILPSLCYIKPQNIN